MTTLSVIVITKNESDDIEDCLKSVAWADEIIVLDSGSIDDTVLKSKQYTPHVFVTDWPGFGQQKNRALEKATGDWVLSIDADEQVSHELHHEILAVINTRSHNTAYAISRLSRYAGKIIRHGDWKNDVCLRLFRRGAASFSTDIVHEKLCVSQGDISVLKGFLYHRTMNSVAEMLDKMNTYSTLSAQMKYAKGDRANIWQAIFHGLWRFFRAYFLRLGFLDGKEGFLLAVAGAQEAFYRYVKMSYHP
jgi:glycosyltransferase involved in cell wall biosynthesis